MIDDSDEQSAGEDGSDLFDIAEDDCGSDTDATSIEVDYRPPLYLYFLQGVNCLHS